MEKEKIKLTREAIPKIALMWKSLPEKKIKVYEKKNQLESTMYEKQLADLMDKGFFLMDDGTKSSEHTAKSIKKASKSEKTNQDVQKKSQDTIK